ncbi:class I SAM-dependent methyltransferase [Leucobacter tenebrionis]|uniref:class I SAM-dependent methyltransferase n=1 Tax=Leucobacter tenebrionis TaxID=2873270 RepID=UPI001CA61901|nr:methyltransferase [Leucobacter tenebrionis]QZY53258.1 methyltransferase [Leucobacter tenebrionis]
MEALAGLFAGLSREPDFEAPELQAYDAADELILETAAASVREADPGELVVIGDRHGALTLGAAAVLGARGIRVHQDPLLGQRALARNAERVFPPADPALPSAAAAEAEDRNLYTSHPLDESLLRGARTVLLQLPRGLEALDEIAWSIARWADLAVRVFAGGRVKHMTRTQNEVLGRYFGEVSAGLGRRKARVLTASGPGEPGPAPFPRWGEDPALPFRVAAYGATFGGPTLDHGSRLLLEGLGDAGGGRTAPAAAPSRIVDLGCGNGVLAVSAALRWPGAAVIATDQSAAAVAATRLTAGGAGVEDRIAIHRADALEAVEDEWADLILLNPPFHTGSTVHTGVAHRLIRACRRALAPAGELRLVFNSHLRYRPLVEREIGPVREIARNRTFTVLAATRR